MNFGRKFYSYIETITAANNVSFWTNYPSRYKFHGIDFYASTYKKTTNRYCYDLINLLGDIGGIYAAVTGVFSVIASHFAEARATSIIATRAYKHPVILKNQTGNKKK